VTRWNGFALLALAACVALDGCSGVLVDSGSSDVPTPVPGGSSASAPRSPVPLGGPSGSWFILESPLGTCTSTTCSGTHSVRELNGARDVIPVSLLDVSKLSHAALEQAAGAASGELVLRGQVGPVRNGTSLPTFVAFEGWRGLPGVSVAGSDSYSSIQTTSGHLVASAVNGKEKNILETVSLSAFLPLNVDTAWLHARILEHGALVAGHIDAATLYAAQVFVRLPDVIGPCPDYEIDCHDKAATYSRDENRCLIPTGCAVPENCPIDLECRAGYRAVLWRTQPAACTSFDCDPAFLAW
jgi:hypothetical protein